MNWNFVNFYFVDGKAAILKLCHHFTSQSMSSVLEIDLYALWYSTSVLNVVGREVLQWTCPKGIVQSEILFRKDPSTFTFGKRWAFPWCITVRVVSCLHQICTQCLQAPILDWRRKHFLFYLLASANGCILAQSEHLHSSSPYGLLLIWRSN
jgi:hypothetical protein